MRIPDPELVGESVNGAIFDLPAGAALVVGAIPLALAGQTPLYNGSLTIRYAISLLVPATAALIPGLLAGEKGGILLGREAWDYIQNHFQVHPRADVVGIRLDGSQAQVLIRELDFGVPVRVAAYISPESTTPIKELTSLIIGENAPELPELLTKYLPTAVYKR
jgi:hypothetical protein